MAKNVVVSLSGGMDSSTLLLRCLSEYDNVTALSFDYGQKHRVELERAQSLIDYVNENGQSVNYQVIKLDGLVNLLNSNLVEGGDDVPEGLFQWRQLKINFFHFDLFQKHAVNRHCQKRVIYLYCLCSSVFCPQSPSQQ